MKTIVVAVGAARPQRLVFGVGSHYYPRARLSMGAWCITKMMEKTAGVQWRKREVGSFCAFAGLLG
jgi:hypothetical protein